LHVAVGKVLGTDSLKLAGRAEPLKFATRGSRGLTPIADDAKWSDLLPVVFQVKVLQSFENGNLLRQSSRPLDGLNADFQLVTEFRKFDLLAGPAPTAEVEFSARLVGADGKVVAARVFQDEEPAKGTDATAAAAALSMPRSAS
jgi:ABC-type uncharacterized transport system auxiliary subunit